MQGESMTEIARNYVIEPILDDQLAGYEFTQHWIQDDGYELGPARLWWEDDYFEKEKGVKLHQSESPLYIPLQGIEIGTEITVWITVTAIGWDNARLCAGLSRAPSTQWEDEYGERLGYIIQDYEMVSGYGDQTVQLGPMVIPPDTEYLGIYNQSRNATGLLGVRLSPSDQSDDGLGVFSGDTQQVDGIEFSWAGEFNGSESIALDPSLAPEPAPGGGNIADKVMVMLGIDPEDEDSAQIATNAVEAVTMYAYAHTRGRGFTVTDSDDIEVVKPDIRAVIVSAATRYAANPSGLSYRAGSETVSEAFRGWTLVEKATLDRYRVRWT